MNEPNQTDAPSVHPARGYVLYVVVIVLMLTAGMALQSVHLQFGLIASQLVAILLPALVFRRFVKLHWPSLRSPGMPASGFALLAVAAVFLGIVANVVTGIAIEALGMSELAAEYERMIDELLRPDSAILAAAGIASICVVAPFCEEFLFRGTLLESQRRGGSTVVQLCIVNGVLFGLLHMNPFGFVGLSIVGAFFAHLTLLTRSLWPAIFAHAVMNGFNGVLLPMAAGEFAAAAAEPTILQLVVALAVFGPVLALLWKILAKRLHARL